MCGISGIATWNTDTDPRRRERAVRRMLAKMAHRGPNGSAMTSRDHVAMAVNRLAIRGVEQVQPPLIEHPDGIVIACNGEIDNHHALRRSLSRCGHDIPLSTDVAVLAPLYLEKGLAFLEELQGVFALALWDARRQRLLLARDRAGERHLYYASRPNEVRFASELSALADTGAALDRTALGHYLQRGYCDAPDSLLAGHHKVSPGEMIVFEEGKARHHRYWRFPDRPHRDSAPSLDAFDPVLRGAVQRQSEVDVDVGVLLSGGLDSALIAAIARDLRPDRNLPAYCIRFAEASYDESKDAERNAERLGCAFVPVTVAAEDIPSTLQALVRTTGEPLADPAWLPLARVACRASRDVRVLLAGEGADELFGGYPTYLGARFAGLYARLPAGLRRVLRHVIEALPPSERKVTVSFLLKRFILGQELDALARHRLWTAHISPEWMRRLGVEAPAWPQTHSGSSRVLDLVQQHDFAHSLPEALLAKADRGGMLHGVEIRAPYLDTDVIDFAATLPPRSRVRGLTTKPFLKDYARRYLPRTVTHRRKRGLSVPLAAWLRGPLQDWARTRLANDHLAQAGLDIGAARGLLDEHAARTADHARALWTLLVLSEWLDWHAGLNEREAVATVPGRIEKDTGMPLPL